MMIHTTRKNFIARNDSFVCDTCEVKVLPAQSTFRNHCPHCLTSKHVDQSVPGDRQSNCGGHMPTIQIEGNNPDKLDLVQQCLVCHNTMRNLVAPDDNRDAIYAVMSNRQPRLLPTPPPLLPSRFRLKAYPLTWDLS